MNEKKQSENHDPDGLNNTSEKSNLFIFLTDNITSYKIPREWQGT